MRAIWITRHGGPEVLEVREAPDPTAKEGEVRVRVKMAGLNFAELSARQGLYPDAPKPPCVVGYEVSGVIDQVGAGVADLAEGDRVMAFTRFGGHADVVVVPAAQVWRMPDAMSFEHGAALPVNYLTAHHMLFRAAQLRPRSTVLVHMAAGGVGLATLQLCRTVPGVTVFGTASASKHDALRSAGCDHPIDYHSERYEEVVRERTGGKGVDLVLDALGGHDWKTGYGLLRPGGTLVAFGLANSSNGAKRSWLHVLRELIGVPIFTPLGLMNDNRGVAGVNMGHLWSELDMLRATMVELVALYDTGAVRPTIDSTFPFDRAADAHTRLHDRKNVGKVLLVP